ncbi:hypothetical protein I4U23_031368 [Adineta vaga]|nr:hypothetical protein I4U23_031368 [Adineta vaga]
MQKPTGMGTSTAIHYYHVGAQMYNWINQHNGQTSNTIHGGMHQFRMPSKANSGTRLVYNGWEMLLPSRIMLIGY